MPEIRLPSLGAEMDEGTLLEWYVKPGDVIQYGDVIALLDTDKAEIEMESFESGTIDSLLIEPGQTVSVGDPIATLEGLDEPSAERPPAAAAHPDRAPVSESVPLRSGRHETASRSFDADSDDAIRDVKRLPGEESSTRIKATPLARRVARQRGIDLRTLSGSGPGGAIVEGDIPDDSTERARVVEQPRISRRREIIAAAMTRSKREIPHYYLSTAVPVGKATRWLATENADRAASERLVLSALLMKAVARAAKRFPEMNGHWLEDGFHPSSSVDLGMVVSLRSAGLVVPTFRNADERSAEDLMAELRDVVGRARAGRLRSSELRDATITITSLGDDGVESILGVIYPPQVAIVGFGGIHAALQVEGGLHGAQPVIRASLAADHRASDGQRGSQFLRDISKTLQDPEHL